MANALELQILESGPRNAVVKLTGVLDTSNATEKAVDITKFQSNENRDSGLLNGFRVDLIEYSISPGIEILLTWESNVPQQITPLAGRGRISATNYGGFTPDNTRSGYTGSINLSTNDFVPGVDGQGNPSVSNFSIILELIKIYKQP
jgi:hypothetical protein